MELKHMTSKNFSPMSDFILVKPTESMKEDEVTESGLVLVMASNKRVVDARPVYGIVQSCGPDCKFVKSGMELIWDISRGMDAEFKDGQFLLLIEDTVLGYRNADEEPEESISKEK